MKYQSIRPLARNKQASLVRLVLRAKTTWVVIFLLALCVAPAPAADPYAEALDKRIANLDTAVEKQAREMAQGRQNEAESASGSSVVWGSLGIVAALFAFRIGLPILGRRSNREKPARRGQTKPAEPLTSESSSEASVSEDMALCGAEPIQSAAMPDAKHAQQSTVGTARFFKFAPGELADALNLLQSASQTEDPAVRQRIFAELCERLRYLCYSAHTTELRPAWQLSVSLEALVRNLAAPDSTVTPSALRTVAGALDMLREFCAVCENQLFAADHAARLLVVDNDAVSRFAMSAALREAFDQPELACDGQTGLALAAKQAYDAIFLEVELPDMDGFELCTRIHNTPLNAATPVVFVTQHDNSEARSKAAETGGHDLIAKPFLPLEIKLKALTLVFRSELERRREEPAGAKEVLETPLRYSEGKMAGVPLSKGVPRPAHESVKMASLTPDYVSESPVSPAGGQIGGFGAAKDAGISQAPSKAPLGPIPRQLEELKGRLQAAILAEDSALRRQLLGEAYVGIHGLSSDAQRAHAPVFARLGASLQALVRKFLDRSDALTSSRLEAVTAAICFLEELCRWREEPALEEPPIRCLVVDDDPISRRALARAIENAFGKSEVACSGEEALTLANQTIFDLILLDMFLPDMDGFTTCAQIRQTQTNEVTPIVFVTSERELEPLHPGGTAGGCGFILKPFFAAEIAVTALTFAFRSRLMKQTRAAGVGEVVVA